MPTRSSYDLPACRFSDGLTPGWQLMHPFFWNTDCTWAYATGTPDPSSSLLPPHDETSTATLTLAAATSARAGRRFIRHKPGVSAFARQEPILNKTLRSSGRTAPLIIP